ncbi:hypothetical protein Vretifemale_14710, partial [Volvox reticuliferus]
NYVLYKITPTSYGLTVMTLLSWGEATALSRRSFGDSYESDIPRVITSGNDHRQKPDLLTVILPSQAAQLVLQQLLRPQLNGSHHHQAAPSLLHDAPTFLASKGQRDAKSGHRHSQANRRQTEPDGGAARPHAVVRRPTGKTQNVMQMVVDGLTAAITSGPAGAPAASGSATDFDVLPSAWPMPRACLDEEHGAPPGAQNTLEALSAPIPKSLMLVTQQAACPNAGNAAGASGHPAITVGATVGPGEANPPAVRAARPRKAKNELRYLQQLNQRARKRQQQGVQVQGLKQGPAAKRRKGTAGTVVRDAEGAAAISPPEGDTKEDYDHDNDADVRQGRGDDAVAGKGRNGDGSRAVEIGNEGNVTANGAARPVSTGGGAVGPPAPLQEQHIGIEEERPLVPIISVRRNRNLSGLASIGVASLVQLAVKRPKNHGIGGPKPVTAAARARAAASTKLQEEEEMKEEEDAARILAPFLAGCDTLGPAARSENQLPASRDSWAADVAAGLSAVVDNGSITDHIEVMATGNNKTDALTMLCAPTLPQPPEAPRLHCAPPAVTIAAVRTAAAAAATVAAVPSAVAEGQAQPVAASIVNCGGVHGGMRNGGTAVDWLAWAEEEDKDLTNYGCSREPDRGVGAATEAVLTPFQSTGPFDNTAMVVQESGVLDARDDQCVAPLAQLPPATAPILLPVSDAASSPAVGGGRLTAAVPVTAAATELKPLELLSALASNGQPMPPEQRPHMQEEWSAPGGEAGASAWGSVLPVGSDKQKEDSPEVGEESEGDEGYFAALTRWAPSLVLHPAGGTADRGIEHYDSQIVHIKNEAGGGGRGGQERSRGRGSGSGRFGRLTHGSVGVEAPGPQHNPQEQRQQPQRLSGRKQGTAQLSAPTDRGKRSDVASPPLASAGGLEVGLYADVKAFQRQQRKARALNGGSGPESTRPVPEVRGPPACKFWRLGRCSKGANCAFAHLGQPVTRLLPCRFWRLGRCQRGEACSFSHDPQLPDPCSGMLEGGICPDPGHCTLGHYALEDMDALREYFRDAAARTVATASTPAAGAPDVIKHQQPELSEAGAMPLTFTLAGRTGNKGLVAPGGMDSWGPGPAAPASGAPLMPCLRPMQPMLQRMVNGGDEDF